MKVIAIPYINTRGEKTDYFFDLTGNEPKKITAGTILDVSEARAKELLGANSLRIQFVKEYVEKVIELPKCLEEMSREELFEKAKKLGLKLPKNTKTINIINKIIEKQNS